MQPATQPKATPPARIGPRRKSTSLATPPRPDALTYALDQGACLTRRRCGAGFRYLDSSGEKVRDAETLARIRSLVIPPAWTDVKIAADPSAHLQATGRDAKGRKQYRYHPEWRSARDEAKYGRMMAFARALPGIRRRVEADLARPGLPREKVLACVVRLLEATLIRVGNEEYARQNQSFGLTTFRDRHAEFDGRLVRFKFKGKSGVRHAIALDDRSLAGIVKRCRDLPGQSLFQYLDDDGRPHPIGSSDVNAYLREVAGEEFTAKDFRTWAGTVLAALALREFEAFDTKTQAKANVVRAIESVAEKLGNTPSVCKKCYVHPEILAAYLDGHTIATVQARASRLKDLPPDEAAVLALLRRRLADDARR